MSQWNLATVLKDLGQLEEARDLLQRAYQTHCAGLGQIIPAPRGFGEFWRA